MINKTEKFSNLELTDKAGIVASWFKFIVNKKQKILLMFEGLTVLTTFPVLPRM